MGKKQFVVLLVIFGVVCAFSGCSKTRIAGKYISEKRSANYLELKSDGTLFLQEGRTAVTGEYEVNGKEITMKFSVGLAAKGTIEGNTIIDKDGIRWTKETNK